MGSLIAAAEKNVVSFWINVTLFQQSEYLKCVATFQFV